MKKLLFALFCIVCLSTNKVYSQCTIKTYHYDSVSIPCLVVRDDSLKLVLTELAKYYKFDAKFTNTEAFSISYYGIFGLVNLKADLQYITAIIPNILFYIIDNQTILFDYKKRKE